MIAGLRKSHARIAWAGAGSGALACFLAFSTPASAGTGQPTPWQIDFQTAVTPVMEAIYSFHAFLTILSAVITLFVLVLLGICILRFNERANPVPSKTTHHTALEIVWTIIPAIILIV